MTTMNEYLENTPADYINNFMITCMFLYIPIATYVAVIYVCQEYDLFIIPISLYAWLLFFYSIKPVYKILAKKADRWEMKKFKLAPFGIGLLRIYWPPYQRMAIKLASNQAIMVCEDAVKNMGNMGNHHFEKEWKRFQEWYPKIASGWTSDQRVDLVYGAICQKIKHEESKLHEGSMTVIIGMGVAHILTTMSVEKDLKKRVMPLADYKKHNVSQETLEAELKKRTRKFIQLREDLCMSNSNEIFKKLFS